MSPRGVVLPALRGVGLLAAGSLAVTAGPAARAAAQPADGAGEAARVAEALRVLDGPWRPEAARYDAARDALTVAAVALAPVLEVSAARLDLLRARAEVQAAEALHAWVDDALALVLAPPWVAEAAHAAVRAEARVTGVRFLVDGGAAVALEVPAAALRDVTAELAGLPWSEAPAGGTTQRGRP